MRKLTRYLEASIAAVLLLLVGCAHPLTMNRIQFVEQGMSSNSLSSMVGQKPPKVFTVVDPVSGLEYQAHMFPMQTGTRTYQHSYTDSEGNLIVVTNTYPVADDFAFLFCEDSLLFWGFLHEYARSDEQLIRQLAPIIMQGLEETRKEHSIRKRVKRLYDLLRDYIHEK